MARIETIIRHAKRLQAEGIPLAAIEISNGRVMYRLGKPLTATGLDTVWHRFKSRLEAEGTVAPGLTFHGLRHTLGHMLKEGGLSDDRIADVLGQRSTAMARHYSDGARLDEGTRGIIRKLDFGK